MKTFAFIIAMLALSCLNEATGQWTTSVNNIYNTNTGNVGIGNSTPTTLLHVAKSMTEPTITVQNLGGTGGATYTMIDALSGANWKFKATNTGGFKIRDHANLLDVIVIEANSSANALYINVEGSVGLGTAAPAASAALDVSSTTKGFLPPRLTQAQILEIASPASGLIVFCTSDEKFYAYVAGASAWKELSFGTGVITQPAACGDPLIINHVAGTVAPVSKTVSYGTVTSIPGEPAKCWITSNLGADQQATSVADATEASAGWYWQFNRMQGYKFDDVRIPNTTWISSIDENLDWQSVNDPCAIELEGGWRLPTQSEWANVNATGGWYDWTGPWNSALKLHAAGYLYGLNGLLYDKGSYGIYRSSTQYSTTEGYVLAFVSGICHVTQTSKADAHSVRCIKD